MQQLLGQHGWAGRELVVAVLEAAEHNTATATAILTDMVAPQPATARHKLTAVAAAVAVAVAEPEAAARPELLAGGCAGGSSNDEAEEQQDPYYRHRRHALQLSRRWQRAARGAAGAYAAERHSEARQLAAQAQRWRQEALAAHAASAERIEAENNQHNETLFELDLHGLHAHEACAALDRRLELLHDLLADPSTAAAAAAAGATGAAARSRLRVVVGRGAHSSGGEASIPRAVENHLKATGLRYHQRLGAIDVQLRAPAALGAARAPL